jgi:parvulin-like peptidyl-prolyl isomerase
VSADVDTAAFTLPVGGVSEPITTNDATVIVRVMERDEVTPQELLLGKEAFREQLLTERRNRFFTSYMTNAKERMQIQINNDVVRRMLAQATAL